MIPDKIYITEYNTNVETGYFSRNKDDVFTEEYISKDTLLEWAKEMQNSPLKNTTESADKHRLSKMIIDKISSL